MRIKNNYECAHEFFYFNESEKYTFNTSCSFGFTSYEADKDNILLNFYSYSTKVAMLYKSNINNEFYLLTHWESMTPTTGKHLSYLYNANPHYDVIQVPFKYGERYTTLNDIKRRLINIIKSYNKTFTKKSYIEYLLKSVESLNQIHYEIESLQGDELNTLNYGLELVTYFESEQYKTIAKVHKKEKAQKTRALNKEKQILIEKIKQEQSYYDVLIGLFKYKLNELQQNKQTIINKILNPNNIINPSFIWFNDDFVETSQHIKVNSLDVIKLLKLYKHNKLKRGLTIDRYTILDIQPSFIKVGCHIIPIENINALIEVIDNEQKEAA